LEPQTSGATGSTLRVVSWNCNGGLRGRKAERLAAELRPDVAVVSECAETAEVPGLESIAWTGDYATKGLGVFARPGLRAALDPSWDRARQWFLPVHLPAVGVDVLAVWAMNQRGGEGQPRWRTRRALGHYAPFLASGRAVVIGDFNDNVRWDRPRYPAFAGTLEELGAKGYTSLYHARTFERHGVETGATLFWQRKVGQPYLIDHAFVPADWLGAVERFDIGSAADWLADSDHMPLLVELRLPLAPGAARPVDTAAIPERPRAEWRYSVRLLRALDATARMHAAQLRKGTGIPYLSHLLGVCSIAFEYGATEDEAIAALLHDAIEDVTPTEAARAVVRSFGEAVLGIVEGCTDGVPGEDGQKAPKAERARRYLAHLATADRSVLLVSASDKLYNARSIVKDLRDHGEALWERFSETREKTLAYYGALVDAFRANPARNGELVGELDRVVTEMHRLAGL
jgi:GTP pyrophosphokinase